SDCWKNSTSAASVPAEPVTSLGAMTLTGTAGGSDSVVMSVGDGILYRMAQSSVLGLDAGWTTSQFNGYGNANGTVATFNSGATIAVQILTDGAGVTGASCATGAYTGESSNLSVLADSCCVLGGSQPGILFTESNASGATAARCPGAAEIGFE